MMNGKTVAVLESRFGRTLVELIEKRGGRALHAPALKEVMDGDPRLIGRLLDDLRSPPPRAAIFQTGVGTHALFNATDTLGSTGRWLDMLAHATVAVRGPKPAAALRSRGVRIDIAAAAPYTTAEVLQGLEPLDLEGARVMVQRYGAANVKLEQALRERAAVVVEIPTYRWSLPDDLGPLVNLMDALESDQVSAVAFTNAAQVHNLFAVAERNRRAPALKSALTRTLIASIGPLCSGALREWGLEVAIEPDPPKLGPFVSALDEALSR